MEPEVVAAWIIAGLAAAVSLATALINFYGGRRQLHQQEEQFHRQLRSQTDQLETAAHQFRESQQLETTRLLTGRFGRAADQLGSDEPAVRLAGVYAMTALADEWDQQREQCVDVLCGYLRLPPRPQHGEAQVRLTIVAVIREHLQDETPLSWAELEFDFHGAHFPDGTDFVGASFTAHAPVFAQATFAGTASFAGASFGVAVFFDGATFAGDVWFEETTFGNAAVFDRARFGGDAGFVEATFGGDARFRQATFAGTADFTKATFSRGTSFDRATLAEHTDFTGAAISEPVDLTVPTTGPHQLSLPDGTRTTGPR